MKPHWLKEKNQVLGKHYDLSVFFLPASEMRSLNKTYRGKDYPANVLSFRLDKNSGEILINQFYKKSDGKSFYLFAHSLLHLKGLRHGAKMNGSELEIMKAAFPKSYEKIINSFA